MSEPQKLTREAALSRMEELYYQSEGNGLHPIKFLVSPVIASLLENDPVAPRKDFTGAVRPFMGAEVAIDPRQEFVDLLSSPYPQGVSPFEFNAWTVNTYPPPTALIEQVGGNHYKDLAIQPAEYCQRNGLSYCESNVVKYVTRHKKKGGLEDIKKAIHNLRLVAHFEYGEELP